MIANTGIRFMRSSGNSHFADANNEEFRAQIHKLQYEVDSLKQEKEETALRHEEELRVAQARADADFKRAQVRLHNFNQTCRRILTHT